MSCGQNDITKSPDHVKFNFVTLKIEKPFSFLQALQYCAFSNSRKSDQDRLENLPGSNSDHPVPMKSLCRLTDVLVRWTYEFQNSDRQI